MLKAPGTLAVLAARPADATGYGRLVLDEQGRVQAIVEHRACGRGGSAGSASSTTGIVAVAAGALRGWLSRLRTAPRRAIYLTDIFAMAAERERTGNRRLVADAIETEGANEAFQLATLERASSTAPRAG